MEVGYICDQCESYNSLDAPVCVVCGATLSEEAGAASSTPSPPAQESSMNVIACTSCGADVPAGNKFCGSCGAQMGGSPAAAQVADPGGGAAKTMFFGAMQTPGRAKLILIKGQGMDGMTYYLQSTEHIAGRSEGPIQFNELDPLLSPRHANFLYRDNQLVVQDLDSTNGVFLRARAPVPLTSGDTFLVGEQLLRVEQSQLAEVPVHDDDGTYFYASPRVPTNFVIVQLLHGGAEGALFTTGKSAVRIGREGNDLNFPDDHFISGSHAELAQTPEGNFTLTDLGSKNGTFHRIKGECELNHGDYVFIGQQLLRVEIT